MNETSAFMRTESKMFPVLQSARLTGHVTDLVAYLLVEHRYRNVSDEEIEINYTFPTPPEAVLTSVTLDLNGKILHYCPVKRPHPIQRSLRDVG